MLIPGVSLMQVTHVSRMLTTAAELQQESCSDSEKLRLAVLLGCIKHGLRRLPQGFSLASVGLDLLGMEFRAFKKATQFENTKLSIRSFMQQEEENVFFWMSPADKSGLRAVIAHIPAFIPRPSQEIRALLPNVDWQQKLPYNSEQASLASIDSSDDEDEVDLTGGKMTTNNSATAVDPAMLTRPAQRQVPDLSLPGSVQTSLFAIQPAAREVCHYIHVLQSVFLHLTWRL